MFCLRDCCLLTGICLFTRFAVYYVACVCVCGWYYDLLVWLGGFCAVVFAVFCWFAYWLVVCTLFCFDYLLLWYVYLVLFSFWLIVL